MSTAPADSSLADPLPAESSAAPTDAAVHTGARLTYRDLLLLVGVALLLLGPAIWGGRPLSIHEGRLPELAREMVWKGGDWLLPTSAGRPWLERPPLPHWLTAWSMMLFGRVGSLWSARLPAALSGIAIALMAAWMGARWFGRGFGVLAGLVTLTTYELYQYSTLAEDDIYLGLVCVACMAMFVRQMFTGSTADGAMLPGEVDSLQKTRPLALDLIATRPMHTVLFFVLLGLTNLAKGPLVGAVPIIGTVGAYLLWTRDTRAMRHFAWLWGWAIFIALTLAWPLWAMKHYPDVVDNWRFDYLGQSHTGDPAAAHAWDHPIWYYPLMMPLALAPWTWATIVGLIVAVRASVGGRVSAAVREKGPAYRFVACWAIVSLLVLSLPARKHHQYLVPIMAPWAILSAIGVMHVGAWLKTRWPRVGAMQLATCVVAGVIIASGAIQLRLAGRDDRTAAELALVAKVKELVPPGEPVLINADLGSLGFFRVQYMVRHDQRLLHNLSYLLDPAYDRPQWYVLTRTADQHYLARLGEVKTLAAAKVSPKDKTAGHNLALFEVTPKAGLKRVEPASVSVLQAMGRAPGPWLDATDTDESHGSAGDE